MLPLLPELGGIQKLKIVILSARARLFWRILIVFFLINIKTRNIINQGLFIWLIMLTFANAI